MPAGPQIVITSGEPAGIGPELCLTLARHDFPVRLVILADRNLLAERARLIGADLDSDLKQLEARCEIRHVPLCAPSQPGQLARENAAYVIELLDQAL
ncbi:MAG: 4-hydroxythreonine-4-phosphate dehydrogenase, partial [Sterolibacterium sp.]|nr:4-hydroxythreonine-4-phosphate dehydrogenase [Sterolibacterium sp.]